MVRPGKPATSEANRLPSNTFVLDNGGYGIKAGFASQDKIDDATLIAQSHVIPNALARTHDRRTYVGAQLDTTINRWNDVAFRRPVEKGQLVNWEAQKEIWEHSFFDPQTARRDLLIPDPEDTTLILTEGPNTMSSLQKNADEIIVEEWGFGGYARVLGSSLNAWNDLHPVFGNNKGETDLDAATKPVECLLVVDCGFSYTTITPLYKGQPIQRAIRRIDVGGKHLTSLLKETISMRSTDLREDTKLVNDIKEDTCFVARNIKTDMEITWKGNRKKQVQDSAVQLHDSEMMEVDPDAMQSGYLEYVLPDYVTLLRGFSRPFDASVAATKKRKLNAMSSPDTTIVLGNERFTIPEVLFSPSDIGANQPGLAQTIMQSLSVLPLALQASLLCNVAVVGGTSLLPGFTDRLRDEIRCLTRSEWVVRVQDMGHLCNGKEGALKATWLGGVRMSRDVTHLRKVAVSKSEYEEYGSVWVGRKFAANGK